MLNLRLTLGLRPTVKLGALVYILLCSLNAYTHSAVNTDLFIESDLIELNPSFDQDNNAVSPQPLIIKQPALSQPDTAPTTITLPKAVPSHKQSHGIKIAIIIDDIGYSHKQGLAAMSLPGALTFAIIPHSPKADFFANIAKQQRKEVILHAPMSNVHNIPLGKNGLSETMDEGRFKEALNLSLDSMPDAIGMNNHMGSLLTQKTLPMEWVMQALQKRSLYFIDSRTTPESIAWETAQAFNIPSLQRDVFLDHTPTTDFISQQFDKLTEIAKRKGYAIGIGHPYPETIEYLKQQLPLLKQQNIELVSASTLVFGHSPNLMSPKNTKSVAQFTKNNLQ